jgi:uncharacterized protein
MIMKPRSSKRINILPFGRKKKPSVKILSIDGGGIRGIIPAMLLAELEKLTGKRTSNLFDLIAGSSTGGVLALALTKPDENGKPQYTAEDTVKLYVDKGERIFSRTLIHKIAALGNIAEKKYPSYGINEVLETYFGDAMLSQALTNVVIPSYEIERRHPFFFKSYYAGDKNKEGYDFPMKLVAKATSAAPTYFEPAKVDIAGKSDYYALVDGGIVANNPSMCALVEAIQLFPRKTFDDMFIVSLGTGRVSKRLPYDQARGWGLSSWAKPMLSSVYDAASQSADHQASILLGSEKYLRIQAKLQEENDELDNADKKNIRDLKITAENLIWENRKTLRDLAELLT